MREKQSLLSRCMGPNAVEACELVRRGELAWQEARRGYANFVHEQLYRIESLSSNRDVDERHEELLRAARDLRTSAGMAAHAPIERISGMLEKALTAMEPFNPDLPPILAVHVGAMRVVLQPDTANEAQLVERRLAEMLKIRLGV